MEQQSHTFVLNTEVVSSAIHKGEDKNMKIVEKETRNKSSKTKRKQVINVV
jgi:hypothetical protein